MRVKIRKEVVQHFRKLGDEAFAQLPEELTVEGTPVIRMPTGEGGVDTADIQRKLAQGWLAFRKKLSELIYTPK